MVGGEDWQLISVVPRRRLSHVYRGDLVGVIRIHIVVYIELCLDKQFIVAKGIAPSVGPGALIRRGGHERSDIAILDI